MNAPIRRVGTLAILLAIALLASATWVQVFRADELRSNPNNDRILLQEYSRQRGQISAGGQVLAASEATDDRFAYLRTYPTNPAAYAPVLGYYSLRYGSAGIERAEDEFLSGSSDLLFGRRLADLFAGRDARGGSVNLTLNPLMQQVAYEQLSSRGFTGSVVALNPATGEILTMVSTPSYDPNVMASHDATAVASAAEAIEADPAQPRLNRATDALYPPGSTFKVITTAAALAAGATAATPLTAAPSITLPGTTTSLENFGRATCGSGATVSLAEAFARSCNAAFVQLGVDTGADALRSTAAAFGIGAEEDVPLPVTTSGIGDIADAAALGQSAIGQRDVSLTPLQNAEIAAVIANGGMRVSPQLVAERVAPDLKAVTSLETINPGRAVTPQVAEAITQMMIASENQTGGGVVAGLQIASKTGTAEHGEDPRNTPPHAWYIAFAPAAAPSIAIAVLVENGGDRGTYATGGSVAAPIGRAVIAAGLGGVPQ